MNYKKLPSAMAIAISMELILSPLPAMAQNDGAKKALEMLNKGIEAYQGMRGGGPQGPNTQYGSDMQKLEAQKTPRIDKQFSLSNMQKIPGLMEYIAKKNQDAARTGGKQINPASLDCKTLQTTLTETNTEVCRNKTVSTINGINPADQAKEAMAYYQQYSLIDKQYQNYSARSNSGDQAYGTGCMEDAMDVLKGFFAYRAEQMDYLNAELDKAFASFKGQQAAELEAIRKASAELGGEGSKFASEYNDTDLFDYGKKFAGAGCDSLMGEDGITNLGKEKGLTGLEKKLKGDFSTIPEGSKYSPETYLSNHADVVNDIKKMADKASEQATLNFSQITGSQEGYSNFIGGLGGELNSESGVHVGLNKSFFADLQNKFTQSRKKLTDQVNVVRSELGTKGASAIAMLSDPTNDTSFEAELTTVENEIKSECVNRSDVDTALSRMYDPKLSKQANKKTAEIIRKRIKAVLADPKSSPTKKMAEIQAIDASGGKRFEMRLDSDYKIDQKDDKTGTVTTKKVSAASKVTAATFFTDIIKNCESQYQVNKLNNKLSAKEAIKQLRTLKSDYAKASKQHAKDIKEEIVKKMIDCGGNGAVASSSTVGSCSPAKLNMNSPSFCAKGAFSCSQNMQKCNEKVSNYTKNLKNDRLNRTKNYNANIDLLRKQLVNTFDNALGKYTQEAESLRGMFGAGFTAPADIERDVEGDKAFNQDFLSNGPDSLKIKDPAVLMTMMKENTKKLKEQIVAQQKEIIGSDGSLQKHIDMTKDNYKNNVLAKTKSIMNDCLAAYNSYTNMLMEQKKQSDEALKMLGEKMPAFCGRYDDIMAPNPAPGCDDGYAEVSDAMIQAAGKAGDKYLEAEARRMRKEMRDICSNPANERSKDGVSTVNAGQVCEESSRNSELNTKLSKFADDFGYENSIKLCKHLYSKDCNPTSATGTSSSSTTRPCEILEKSVINVYNSIKGNQSGGSSAVASNSHGTSDTGSFCNASNNSGRQNAKPGYGSSAGPAPASAPTNVKPE